MQKNHCILVISPNLLSLCKCRSAFYSCKSYKPDT